MAELKTDTEQINDDLSRERQRLDADAAEVQERLAFVENNKQAFLDAQRAKLDERIARKPVTKPKKKGHITMRQFLEQIRADMERNPDAYYDREVGLLRMAESKIAEDLGAVETKLAAEKDVAVREM